MPFVKFYISIEKYTKFINNNNEFINTPMIIIVTHITCNDKNKHETYVVVF